MALESNRAVRLPTADPPADDDAPTPSPEDLAVVNPPRRGRRWALLVVVGVSVAAALAFVTRSGDPTTWQTEPATTGDLATEVTAVGTLAPITTVEVGSHQTGEVLRVLVDENAEVHAGDVLAELDPEPFEAALAQAEAQVASASASVGKAKATLANATDELERTRRLEAKGASTASDGRTAALSVDTVSAELRMARASLAQAEASRDRARQDLEDTVIVAPIDGVVIHRYVEPGQTVVSAMSATALFEVASDLRALRIDAGVDESDIGRVAAGQTARFTVSAWPDRTFDAEVASVDLAPDPTATVVTYDADLHVVNDDLALRPGMTATASIEVAALRDVVRVPALALRYRPPAAPASTRGDAVWLLVDGVPTETPVEVLGSDGALVAVTGVDAGAEVIVGGGR